MFCVNCSPFLQSAASHCAVTSFVITLLFLQPTMDQEVMIARTIYVQGLDVDVSVKLLFILLHIFTCAIPSGGTMSLCLPDRALQTLSNCKLRLQVSPREVAEFFNENAGAPRKVRLAGDPVRGAFLALFEFVRSSLSASQANRIRVELFGPLSVPFHPSLDPRTERAWREATSTSLRVGMLRPLVLTRMATQAGGDLFGFVEFEDMDGTQAALGLSGCTMGNASGIRYVRGRRCAQSRISRLLRAY